jgi:hypothetical protein
MMRSRPVNKEQLARSFSYNHGSGITCGAAGEFKPEKMTIESGSLEVCASDAMLAFVYA